MRNVSQARLAWALKYEKKTLIRTLLKPLPGTERSVGLMHNALENLRRRTFLTTCNWRGAACLKQISIDNASRELVRGFYQENKRDLAMKNRRNFFRTRLLTHSPRSLRIQGNEGYILISWRGRSEKDHGFAGK